MSTLPKELRSKLEKAVLAARDQAAQGARAAMTALGVGDAKKPDHLDAAGEGLRRRLRARGRQAGDVRRADDSQETEHLVQECAYEHWHRMLFARFLAENDLLIHPEVTVAVSLDECEELAREEGLDRWELAARYAQQMGTSGIWGGFFIGRIGPPLLKTVEIIGKLTQLRRGFPWAGERRCRVFEPQLAAPPVATRNGLAQPTGIGAPRPSERSNRESVWSSQPYGHRFQPIENPPENSEEPTNPTAIGPVIADTLL